MINNLFIYLLNEKEVPLIQKEKFDYNFNISKKNAE